MCPIDGCAKKVIEINDVQYHCSRCKATHQTFKWGYMTKVNNTILDLGMHQFQFLTWN
jgi:hypothetical protein